MSPLRVTHRNDLRAELAARNLPSFYDAMTPEEARALARALLAAADDCERLAESTRLYGPENRAYSLTPLMEPTPASEA